MKTNIPSLITKQGHAFHAQCSNGHFAWFAWFNWLIVFIQHFKYDQFRLTMPSPKLTAFRKGSLHFCRCISGIQFYIPGIGYFFSGNTQRKICVADIFPDTNSLLYRGFIDINVMFIRKLDQFNDERRNSYDGCWF